MKKETKQASLTVEASLILPFFLFAMTLIGYLGKLITCQEDVQWALTRIAREASAEYGATKNQLLKSQAYYQAKFIAYMKETGLSVSFADSKLLQERDEIDLVVTYRMKTPFSLLPLPNISMRQRVHTRAFTGVERRGHEDLSSDRKVYITETGRVYHYKVTCSYLKLSISQIQYGDLSAKRNESGGTYKTCERCCGNKKMSNTSLIWITNYGDRYHASASCSGLKRSIREIALSEVGGRTPCSKCGRER